MDCGVPFCMQGCPLGNLIPEFNDLIYRDENGVDHIFYAARRDELVGEWHDLLAEYDDIID